MKTNKQFRVFNYTNPEVSTMDVPMKLQSNITFNHGNNSYQMTLNEDKISYKCTKNGVFEKELCVGMALCKNDVKKAKKHMIYETMLRMSIRPISIGIGG